MVNNCTPPIHPGSILREEFLVPLGISATRLAQVLQVSTSRIGAIARGQRPISVEMAMRLSRYFGTTPQFWLGLQMTYDLKYAEAKAGAKVVREVYPREAFVDASGLPADMLLQIAKAREERLAGQSSEYKLG